MFSQIPLKNHKLYRFFFLILDQNTAGPCFCIRKNTKVVENGVQRSCMKSLVLEKRITRKYFEYYQRLIKFLIQKPEMKVGKYKRIKTRAKNKHTRCVRPFEDSRASGQGTISIVRVQCQRGDISPSASPFPG